MSELPKGWRCKCGKFNPFHVWVYAHWDILIEGRCTIEPDLHSGVGLIGCGAIVEIKSGKVLRELKKKSGKR